MSHDGKTLSPDSLPALPPRTGQSLTGMCRTEKQKPSLHPLWAAAGEEGERGLL